MHLLETEYTRDNRVTICRMYAIWQGEHLAFTGTAIRHPDDSDNPALGESLAWARANAKALKRVQRWTQGQIRQADHNASITHKPLEVWQKELANYKQKFESASQYIDRVLFKRAGA
jgi:hypothetical protein